MHNLFQLQNSGFVVTATTLQIKTILRAPAAIALVAEGRDGKEQVSRAEKVPALWLGVPAPMLEMPPVTS